MTTRRQSDRPRLDAARAALDEASTAEPGRAVEPLARARALLDGALDEAMAEAVLDGASLRAVAELAGVAPNTVPPRLGRTTILGGYASPQGRVTADGVSRARYDRERGTPPPADPPVVEPLRFRRRNS
ncbi:hypothetical protein [Isoptericola dokdonensis]|uniref:Uncharacterized protein n=1 Tax=Isoptericola dokdonensis DS-3 TaxID=1300344 RepID=A0A161I8R2_9MICO|nr:hypothetical protein [Isoptericola dokdonensis]ANC32158.1 hypothetical protein I598_2628 [Isoptericola dokdonensis DS-3]